MTTGWPPERPGRRRPDAPSGGSHRRSALRTPPYGIDLGDGGNGDPDSGQPGYADSGQRGYADSGQRGYEDSGQRGYEDSRQRGYEGTDRPRYRGTGPSGYGGAPVDGRDGRRPRHGGPGQQGPGYGGPVGQGRSDPGYAAPEAPGRSYYNLAYGAHGYDAPDRGTGDSGGPSFGAPVADVQAPGSRGYRGTRDGQPGYDAPRTWNAGSPRSRHGRPGQAGPRNADPGPAEAPRSGPGPSGSRPAGPGEPRYAGPGPADPRYGGPGRRGPGRGGPQYDAPGYGSPRPAGPGPGRGSGPQAPPSPRGGQPGHRRRTRQDDAGDDYPPRRDGGDGTHRRRRTRPDSDRDEVYPGRRDGGEDAYRARRTRPDSDRDEAYPGRRDGGDDAYRARRKRPDVDGADAHLRRGDRGDDAYRDRRARPGADGFLTPASSRDVERGQATADAAGAAGAATAWMPAVADTAIGTRSPRRAATPDREPRPGSRRAQNTGDQSRPATRGQTTIRPGRPDRRPVIDEPAEPARRRDNRPAGRPGRRPAHRRWLWGGVGVLVLAGALAGAMVVLHLRGPGGPQHSLATPLRLGAFTRSSRLTKQMNVGALERNIIAQSSGQASHLVSSVYEAGSPVGGGTPAQVMLFIGGQLSGGSPATSVKSFTQHFKGAQQTGAGQLGGAAACVGAQAKGTGGQTVCVWFDNNTFGELVSPNMPVSALASELRAIRPDVEHVVKAGALQ